MTIDEILNGLEGLKEDKKTEVKGLLEKLVEVTGKDASRKANSEAKNVRDRLKKVLGALELDEDDDLDTKIEELKTLKKPETKEKLSEYEKLFKEVTKLKKDFAEKVESEKKAVEKTQAIMKRSKLIDGLSKKDVHDPEMVADVLVGKMRVKEDDTVVFLDGETEVEVDAGISSFLKGKDYLVKNVQSPGAGTFAGGQAGTQKPSMEQLASMPIEEYAKNRPK